MGDMCDIASYVSTCWLFSLCLSVSVSLSISLYVYSVYDLYNNTNK